MDAVEVLAELREDAGLRDQQGQAALERAVALLADRTSALESGQAALRKEVGNLSRTLGGTAEEDALDALEGVVRRRGYSFASEPTAVDLDGDGELDLLARVRDASGTEISVLGEAKVRLRAREVRSWAARLQEPAFRRQMVEAGAPGPYLAYAYGIRVYGEAVDAARAGGSGSCRPRARTSRRACSPAERPPPAPRREHPGSSLRGVDSLGIIRQLEQDAGLRAQLRAVLLGEELLDLPELFRQLASRVDQLAEAQARTEAALRDLVLETGRRFEQADVRFDRLEQGLAEVRGRSLESGIRGHPRRYLPRDLAADVGMVEGPSEEALLASLSSDAAAEIAWVGALVEGRSRLDNTSVYFVVEASVRAHVDDLERAARRAMLLAEAGFEARAVVVTRTDPGEHIIGEAHSRGVMLISEPKGVLVPSSPAA